MTTTFPPKALSLPPSVRGCYASPPTGRLARSRISCRPSTPGSRARSSDRSGCSRPSTRWCSTPIRRRARALGRKRVATPYLGLVNYTSNLRRLGFTDEDLDDGGSDRLVDALVAHGTAEQVAAQLQAHLDAGADHVCVQLLTEGKSDALPGYAKLARGLGLDGLTD